jgi:hypothetical protein
MARSVVEESEGAFRAADYRPASRFLMVRGNRIAQDDGMAIVIAKAEDLGGGEAAPGVSLAQLFVDAHADGHCSTISRAPGENSQGMLR